MNLEVAQASRAQHMLTNEEVAFRLKRMRSILTAIESGELLSVLPESPDAQTNHIAAMDLLAILGREIVSLSRELQEPLWARSAHDC